MKGIIQYPRFTLVTACIIVCIGLLTRCVQQDKQDNADVGDITAQVPDKGYYNEFAGSRACANCHRSIYDTHIQTAHYLTSVPADGASIKGSFEPGRNTFAFSPGVSIAMEKKDSGYYQVLFQNDSSKGSQRFDIVVGSGTKGQTYLTWKRSRLSQLPITWWTASDQWTNSPGYPDKPAFNRPITSRCLECHSTYFHVTSPKEKEPEDYDQNQILFGVTCERCHGPAAQHVTFHNQHPDERQGRFIVNPAHLSRQRNLDLCILCHGGRLTKLRPSFSYRTGDTLTNYFAMTNAGLDAANIDVHGNQYGLLASSKCFKMSQMTCLTCHNTHTNERGQMEAFSRKCLSCHSSGLKTAHRTIGGSADSSAGNNGQNAALKAPPCKMTAAIGKIITANCIDCHMPKQSSRAIAVMQQGMNAPTVAYMRSHHIKIYPDEAKKFKHP